MSQVLSQLQEMLFPSIAGVVVVSVETADEAIRVEAQCTAASVACPDCGGWSEQVHSSYLRFPADLPSAGQRAVLALRVRRFWCRVSSCPRRTFAEQVPGLTRRHGQATERLRSAMGAIGLALAGRAGARLAKLMGISVSRSTLLRRVMDLADPPSSQPRAVGVDDFALRKVILSRPKGVLDVMHDAVVPGVRRGGRGYLRPSSTRNSGREHAGSACRVADDAAGIVDGLG